MVACERVQENLAAYQEGRLAEGVRAGIEAHLAQCSACQVEVEAQGFLRVQLRALKQCYLEVPPPHIWTNASQAWDRHDAACRRHFPLRLGIAVACVLLLALSALWIHWKTRADFPVAAVMRDFRAVQAHPIKPQYPTSDADKAAHWLRTRLGVDVSLSGLPLSKAELLGADIVSTPTLQLGRLLYRNRRGVLAIYVAPHGTRFPHMEPHSTEDQPCIVEAGASDIGFYGWQHDSTGYGLLLARSLSAYNAFPSFPPEFAAAAPGGQPVKIT